MEAGIAYKTVLYAVVQSHDYNGDWERLRPAKTGSPTWSTKESDALFYCFWGRGGGRGSKFL